VRAMKAYVDMDL